VPGVDQRIEDGNGEVGRAHENDAHQAFFRALRSSMSRFVLDSRSA
jgi:hypothetical protein